MGKPSAPIPRLLEFLRLVHRMERGQAFSAALGIDYPHFERLALASASSSSSAPAVDDHNASRLVHYDAATKTLSAKIDLHPLYLPLPPRTGNRPTTGWTGVTTAATRASGETPPFQLPPLSTFQAVIDDLTTWALVLADPTRGRAGASVTLQSVWTPPFAASVPATALADDPPILLPHQRLDAVTVRATADKVGQNLGFASAEVRTLQGDLICIGSQVKYLPMGRLMDFMQSSRGWGLAKLYTEYGISLPPTEEIEPPPLAPLFDSLRFDDDGHRATFDVTPVHASLAGAIHGGCQSILMELVARDCLQRRFPHSAHDTWTLQSMSVDYLSPPSPRSVELAPELLLPASMGGGEGTAAEAAAANFEVVPVQVSLESGGRRNSRGLLLFRAAPSHWDLPHHPSARL